MASPLFVHDVKEKEITEAKSPSFPQIKSGTSGFPEHKKRSKVSAFKQKRQGIQPDDQQPQVFLSSSGQPLASLNHGPAPVSSGQSFMANEKMNIDRENSQRLASMSPQEIEQARQELFSGLDSSILERLLKRANLDEAGNTSPFDQPQPTPEATSSRNEQTDSVPAMRIDGTSVQTASSAPTSKGPGQTSTISTNNDANSAPPKPYVSNETDEHNPSQKQTTAPEPQNPATDNDDSAPAIPPQEYIINAPSSSSSPPHETAHWPRAPHPADLDPSDPNFLQNLHEKYFPSLPADPSKLAWMAPVPTPNSPADRDSPYYPGQDSLPISALRFDFRGALLPPRISRAVPTSKGLHHHGEAPEAAGYTIRELARLARSAVPGQRCVAYQTLGRILYRLGTGEFGGVGRDDVSMGIWREVEEGAVLRSLHDEIGTEDGHGRGRGHRSARAFATEAIWLFEKSGWKDKLKKA
ncbi:RPAP1-like protein [Xylaria sp. FL1042]|nr:RPAP1-like protein [Xylaria sp. FL1042]